MLLSLPEIAAIRMPTFHVVELFVCFCVCVFLFLFLFFFFPSVLPGQSLCMLTCAV